MKPQALPDTKQTDLFRSRLDQILDMQHSLVELSNKIDWHRFNSEFGALHNDSVGRPPLPTRLMVGLAYLKYLYNVSDERLTEAFLENPYWQFFCGYEYFQHKLPFDRSSITRWRKRIGEERILLVFQETVDIAKRASMVTDEDFKKVIVDTTVQEKAIAFPTDSRLYAKAISCIVRECGKVGIKPKQSYSRVSKRALFQYNRYASARQFKRANKHKRQLNTYLGRLIRDVERKKQAENALASPKLDATIEIAKRVHTQKKEDKNKIYAMHAPEVSCIAKGKVNKKYEFGCKTSVATTSNNSWIVGIKSHQGNPYDRHTLEEVITQIEQTSRVKLGTIYVDRGYRGHKVEKSRVEVIVCNTRKRRTSSEKHWERRRAAIEPKIGHLKTDNRLGRNFLKGTVGDAQNAILAACGANLRKILAILNAMGRAPSAIKIFWHYVGSVLCPKRSILEKLHG